MKAIKFVILGAGLLGLISFFLPLAKHESTSYSAFGVIQGVDAAKSEANKIADQVQDNLAANADGTRAQDDVEKLRNDFNEGLDAAKTLVYILLVAPVALALIGGVGVARKKLGRLGGTGALLIGLLGTALSGLVLAAFTSAEFKSDGGSAGIACYTMFIGNITGMICGLLTLIKPDIGGKFG